MVHSGCEAPIHRPATYSRGLLCVSPRQRHGLKLTGRRRSEQLLRTHGERWSGSPILGPVKTIVLTMTIAATPVPLSEAKARLSELTRRVRQQHERITLTRNGEAEAVLLSVDDLEGMEMTLEILGDSEAVGRISESLAALGRGESGADLDSVRQDLARRRATGV